MSKDEIKKIIELPGNVRGQALLTDFEYVKNKEGEKGIILLEEKIKEWSAPINYKNIKVTGWYPIGLRVVSLLAIKEAFGYKEEDIFKIGDSAPKYSFIVKMLMKYFLSIQKTFEEASNYWKRHYSIGELEAVEYNEREKYFILRLKDFKVHPILCSYYAGYFLRIGKYVQQSKKHAIRETKCVHKENSFCEYVISWE